jgi:sensor histidine kinase regulating citrate/malate metabolism
MKEFRHMKLEKHKNFVNTDSPVVNAVINSKFSYAYEHNIKVDVTVLCKVFRINELDMSILLANLLDNAIEACERNHIPSIIQLTIEKEAAYLRICVTNTIKNSILSKNTDMDTTKSDKKHHGYGMKSIREIVNKYEGSMELDETEGEFAVDILLKME